MEPVTKLSSKELRRLREIFDNFDYHKSGKVSISDVGTMLQACGHRLSEEELRETIPKVGRGSYGTVEFSELLTVVMEQKKIYADTSDIEAAFKEFDSDGNGFISKDELRAGFRLANLVFTEKDVEEIIRSCDADGDGQLNFLEFSAMLRGEEES